MEVRDSPNKYFTDNIEKTDIESINYAKIQEDLTQQALDLIQIDSGRYPFILDIGTGYGNCGTILKKRGFQCIGVDIVYSYLIAQSVKDEYFPSTSLVKTDVCKQLPFRAGSIDAAIGINFLNWLFITPKQGPTSIEKRVFQFFEELHRCLRIDGIAIFNCSLKPEETSLISKALSKCGFLVNVKNGCWLTLKNGYGKFEAENNQNRPTQPILSNQPNQPNFANKQNPKEQTEKTYDNQKEPITQETFAFVLPQWVRHMNRPICTIDIHPSGQYFATGGWDNYGKIWSFPALLPHSNVRDKLIAILHDHTGPVNCVRFSPDGKYLATCGDDSMVYIWQRVPCFGKPSTFGVPDSALTPNKPIQKWTSKSLTSSDTRDITGISWSPDSTRLASCSIAGFIILWDVKTCNPLWKIQMSVGCKSIAYDPLSRYIAVQLITKCIQIVNINGHLVKEIKDKFQDEMEETIMSHITWTPDGSFLGAPSGYYDSYITPFFQRDSFSFAFALEGHVQPSTCVACPPFLLRSRGNICSLTAVADTNGVLSVWLIGRETKPLLVLNGISSSATNDVCWSHDGRCLLVALESDPLDLKGGVVALFFKKGLFPDSSSDSDSSDSETNSESTSNPHSNLNTDSNSRSNYDRSGIVEIIDQSELDEIKMGILGETTLRTRSAQTLRARQILQSLEHKEKEVDLEVLQLSTEEVLERQIETVKDGVRWIQPVLLTAVEKKTISHKCYVNVYQSPQSTLAQLYHAPSAETPLSTERLKKRIAEAEELQEIRKKEKEREKERKKESKESGKDSKDSKEAKEAKELQDMQEKRKRALKSSKIIEELKKQANSLKCSPIEWIPEGFKWPAPIALPDAVFSYIVLDQYKCIIVAAGNQILKVSMQTGMRLACPYALETKCRHLSINNNKILAVSMKCHVIDLESMTGIPYADAPQMFTDFRLVLSQQSPNENELIGRIDGMTFLYDVMARVWRGALLTKDEENLSMDTIEAISKLDEIELAVGQWYDYGQSIVFAAQTGFTQKSKEFLEQMKKSNCSEQSQIYVKNMENIMYAYTHNVPLDVIQNKNEDINEDINQNFNQNKDNNVINENE